ncbi:hypothetical protein [Caulobacter sp. RL271]|jgi:hypothetical protein|uniref:DUF1508 domain-containing protein n=1 Tax=Caulobacter segnis TaxID=88688 RepID=A0ABY4ZSH2_9CAUL|nr:hypothetical protein [Caulobacter segnis]USQ95334.1 hypothetical protein MZV50_22730 [Caulobacter segnis]
MSGQILAQPLRPAGQRTIAQAAPPMVRFSITPTQQGIWLWRTFDQAGQLRAQGLASTRKQAAALVIRQILLVSARGATPPLPHLSAKAA